MEWVETTGRSVQEAKEAALDELGVDEADAEFEVISEPQTGLFGRLRSEARVRARVRPTAPRSKDDRRNRDRRRRSGGGDGGSKGAGAAKANGSGGRDSSSPDRSAASSSPGTPDDGGTETGRDGAGGDDDGSDDGSEGAGGSGGNARRRNRNRRRGASRPGGAPTSRERAAAELADDDQPGKGPDVEVDMDQQGEVAAGFLRQLAAEFGLDADLSVTRPDEDTVELQLSGNDLGILIGPKGATLLAVQNLTRTVVFNETGGNNGHINVDVGGYRQKRTEALVRFAHQVADQVRSSGSRTPLEPMSAVDRKVVHDTISGIEGVSTISEGEEPRRRVVVLPG